MGWTDFAFPGLSLAKESISAVTGMPTTTTTTPGYISGSYSTNSPLQQGFQDRLMTAITKLLPQTMDRPEITPYQGKRVAELSGNEVAAENLAQGMVPGAQAAQGISSNSLQGLYDLANNLKAPTVGNVNAVQAGNLTATGATRAGNLTATGATRAQNPLEMSQLSLETPVGDSQAEAMNFFRNSIQNPAMKNWQENVLPQVQESFESRGAGSSGAANAAIAKSGTDLQTNMLNSLSNLLYNNRENALNREATLGEAARNREMSVLDTLAGRNFAGQENYASRNDTINSMLEGENFAGQENYAGRADTINAMLEGENYAGNRAAQALNVGIDTTNAANNLNAATLRGNLYNSAIGNAGNIFDRTTGALASTGATARGIDQMQLAADQATWNEGQDYNNPWLQYLNTGMKSGANEPIVQGPVQNTGWLNMLLPAAGQLGATYLSGGAGGVRGQ